MPNMLGMICVVSTKPFADLDISTGNIGTGDSRVGARCGK